MKKIIVTGGSGYVAEWVISDLLNHDYRVHASLRSVQKEARVRTAISSLVDTEKMKQLSFFQADLTRANGWANEMVGADSVFHIASPLGTGTETEAELVSIAKNGTLNVLRGAKIAGVKKIIMISSQAAATARRSVGNLKLDDNYWTDMSNPELVPYYISKVEAEKAAWKFAKQNGLDLTTLLPGGIFGPLLDSHVQSSNALVSELIKMSLVPKANIEVTDVRDLAAAMRLALNTPAAINKRYNVGTTPTTFLKIVHTFQQDGIRSKKLTLAIPNEVVKFASKFQPSLRQLLPQLGVKYWHDSTRAHDELHWHNRCWQETMKDSATSLKDWGIIKTRR